MAENATYEGYKESGFHVASGTETLQKQMDKLPTSEEQLRTQAVEQYADTYKRLDDSYAKQLASIAMSHSTDAELLNAQYQKSVASMTEQLKKRGLQVTPMLVQAQTAALNKHRNDALAIRSKLYEAQKAPVRAQTEVLRRTYEDAINARIASNRATTGNVGDKLLDNLAQLQQGGIAAYLNYLTELRKQELDRKKGRSGGGGGYRTAATPEAQPSNVVGASGDYFSGGGVYQIAGDPYASGAQRRTTNLDKSGTAAKAQPNTAAARAYNAYIGGKPVPKIN